MGLFQWGEKRFARGIAKAMIRSYKSFKVACPNLSEVELIKKTLSTRPGLPAETLLKDVDDDNFWKNVAGSSFVEVISLLVRLEYVEYMKGNLNIEDQETKNTFDIFKKIILEVAENENL